MRSQGPSCSIRQCSPEHAATALESAIKDGVPLLLPGLVSHWNACRSWQGQAGLDRMHSLAAVGPGGQPQNVQVMYSDNSTFIGRLSEMDPASMSMHEFLEEAGKAAAGQPGPHLYLAQHTLTHPGSGLLVDTPLPGCLHTKPLTSTNMWMCIRGSRSNIHYDPYTNLLCVAVGSKRVSLWPPAATPFLYPAPLTSDSSNHSMVNFAAPDYAAHPMYRHALEHQQTVMLQEGDALFIPEGYWHQVDSSGITIAVNFWWESPLNSILQGQRSQSLAHLRLVAAEAQGHLLHQLLAELPTMDLDLEVPKGDVELQAHLLTSKLEQAEEQHVFSPLTLCVADHVGGSDDPVSQADAGSMNGVHATQVLTSQRFYQTLYATVDDAGQVFARLLELRQQLMRQVYDRLILYVLR